MEYLTYLRALYHGTKGEYRGMTFSEGLVEVYSLLRAPCLWWKEWNPEAGHIMYVHEVGTCSLLQSTLLHGRYSRPAVPP